MPLYQPVGCWAVVGVALALTTTADGLNTVGAAENDVTFTRDIAPILYENCVSCHRPGELAPMALRTYDEVRPWARGIKDKVITRAMPPWFADPAHGVFKNDTRLSDVEIGTISAWVDAGAPKGDIADLPPLPTATEGWQLGEPNHIVTLPTVTIPAEGDDYYPDLSFTLDIPVKRWIRAIEVMPSNRKATHHSVIFTSNSVSQAGTESGFFDVLAVWSVGTNPHKFPEGMGRWVYPDQQWTINAHYHPTGTVETDSTKIGLYFGEGKIQKEIMAALAGTTTFEIPPHATNHQLRSSYIIDQDISVISYFPHMHVRGLDMTLIANYPNGERETLISVPKYDFDWQLFYYPAPYVSLPAGTRLDITAHYDNSAANTNNPNPDVPVRFGLQTTDEMMFNVFEFIADEGVSPTPASDETRRDALLASLPDDSAYRVNLTLGRRALPTTLHLPRSGEGTWYIPMRGNLLVIPAENVMWDGDSYRFDMQMRLGQISGRFLVSGEVDTDGVIQGMFEAQGGGFSMFSAFEGTRAGADEWYSVRPQATADEKNRSLKQPVVRTR